MIPTMNVFVCIGLLCLVSIIQSQFLPYYGRQHQVHEKIETQLTKTSLPTATSTSPNCTNGKCGGVSYEDILECYGDLFFTKDELQKKLLEKEAYTKKEQIWQLYKPHAHMRKRAGGPPYYDGDRCCPTSTDWISFPKMKNTRGQLRTVVHFDDRKPNPMYQLIVRGQCGYKGACHNCQQEYAIYHILVVAESVLYVEFDEFYIPSYCSCKG